MVIVNVWGRENWEERDKVVVLSVFSFARLVSWFGEFGRPIAYMYSNKRIRIYCEMSNLLFRNVYLEKPKIFCILFITYTHTHTHPVQHNSMFAKSRYCISRHSNSLSILLAQQNILINKFNNSALCNAVTLKCGVVSMCPIAWMRQYVYWM